MFFPLEYFGLKLTQTEILQNVELLHVASKAYVVLYFYDKRMTPEPSNLNKLKLCRLAHISEPPRLLVLCHVCFIILRLEGFVYNEQLIFVEVLSGNRKKHSRISQPLICFYFACS